MELLYQGAEARVFKTTMFGETVVVKERFKKAYRHPELEARLTSRRLAQEVRTSARAIKAGVLVPCILAVEPLQNKIVMEFIDGKPLRERFEDPEGDDAYRSDLCVKLGKIVAKLHNAGIVHGDLTTSNVLEREIDKELVLVDFGLAKASAPAQDKAVDLYVLERAFISTHPKSETLFSTFLDSYSEVLADKDQVLNHLRKVQMQGRKRDMIG